MFHQRLPKAAMIAVLELVKGTSITMIMAGAVLPGSALPLTVAPAFAGSTAGLACGAPAMDSLASIGAVGGEAT